ncbi:GPI transamidase component PIG-S [Cinnamomum micranthum f. kanehirae]|uniref:GPI transamidase component PIG-S n=1 Tax=Cinnamomum micranthum f. kanehirae TaxID=337451 RepID=A0A3S3MTI4_9MAGN|nr:GPI transamidase component PIG-S [Cinnamomum micranthum f. kanehirae]
MGETSETPPEIPQTEAPKPLRKSKPGCKRLILTLTVLSSFILGLPFLLKSTEIYRSPLPFRAIDSLSDHLESNPLSLPCRFQAVFVGFDGSDAERLELLVLEEMRRRTGSDPVCGGCGKDYSVSVTIDSGEGCVRSRKPGDVGNSCLWRCGAVGFDENFSDDEVVDEILDLGLGGNGDECLGSGGRVYSVVVMNWGEEETRVVVGKHRHGWIAGRVSEMDAVSLIGKVFVDVFMNGGKKEGEMVQGKGEFMPVGADGSIVLSFSLLNSNPNDWVYDWDFRIMDENLLAPVVEVLSPIAKISVESQVLYHTPKSSLSSWDEKLASYIFSTKDLSFFVNSNEWHLDTSIAAAGRSKILQFVVYVPSAQECPLLLRLPSGEISSTNAFISPMWGGVIVWNPQSCSRDFHGTGPAKHTISDQDVQRIFKIFMGQLRLLFGLKSDNLDAADSDISNFLASGRGFAEWELDVLFRHHTCFNLNSCATTLGSLSRLVQSLPRMIVMEEIGKQVKLSLEAATLAQNNASRGVYDASAVSSREARALAEDAFFHPSIMSLSYFSIEHYLAIYMPFFAPVALHVLLAVIKELRRYKQERAKFFAWIAQPNAS